jgi:hypothetical protein
MKLTETLLRIVDRLPEYESYVTRDNLIDAICGEFGLCVSCKKRKVPKAIRGDGWYPQFCNVCAKKLERHLGL